jgi:cytochrome c-type biogenesis protein CcmE
MDDDELVAQIRREEPVPVEAPVAVAAPPAKRGVPAWVKIGIVFVLLGAGVAFLLSGTGASDAFIYSKLVDEVMAEPDRYIGRELRVEGQLRRGSVHFTPEPTCEHRFVLTRGEHVMRVRYPRCVVPDTFRDNMSMDVVVEGQLQRNGTFLADQVIPRCPSKYEMRERQENGESAPHAMPAGSEQS